MGEGIKKYSLSLIYSPYQKWIFVSSVHGPGAAVANATIQGTKFDTLEPQWNP